MSTPPPPPIEIARGRPGAETMISRGSAGIVIRDDELGTLIRHLVTARSADLSMEVALGDVAHEIDRARTVHPPLHSAHEAYAVILEELDEYKAEVWRKSSERDRAAMRRELVQLAAMAVRAIGDLGL